MHRRALSPSAAAEAAREPRPLTSLHGVGDALAARLAVLGIQRAQDLLFLLPLRYEDRTRIVPMGELRAGMRVSVEGEVLLSDVAFRGRRQLVCRIADGSGSLNLRFFYFNAQQQQGLARGVRVRCFGQARKASGGLEFVHPEYRRIAAIEPAAADALLTAIYPSTEGVTQPRLRMLIKAALDSVMRDEVHECLPAELLRTLHFPALHDALRLVHRPAVIAANEELVRNRHPAQRRLAFEELLAHQLSLRQLRQHIQSAPAPSLASDGSLRARLLASLPFRLTGAQERVIAQIEEDMKRPTPMLRLIQGDVGCGKTLVAAVAATRAVEAGKQVALMAPTELLAEQHAQNFKRWFHALGVPVTLLTGRFTGRARESLLTGIRAGHAAIVIGTHALFQESVEFSDLALVIVDEQHRFGVDQRLSLHRKAGRHGMEAHTLIMTATPIPRTLAMTAYADLDVSIIDELPPGRTPVKTVALPQSRRADVVQRIRSACLAGRQAYWVCPLIDESEEMPYQAAEITARELSNALPELRVGLIHGRMAGPAKDRIMSEFKRGTIQLLVATTVIEVGVDVPNASLMVIENAERMGLAQLHQLRGRVGRGEYESSCLLLYRTPMSRLARERLAVMRGTNDGFEVARRDLQLRGPGEVLGTRQTGLTQMRVADLSRDADLLPAVQSAAEQMLTRWPEFIAPLIQRWIGASEQYGRVG